VVAEHGTSIAAYDLDEGKVLWRLPVEKQASRNLLKVVAPPDGARFYEIDDTSIRVRSVERGAEIAPPIDFAPSADAPREAALSADGQLLTVATRRGVLLRFRLQP
jgi:hypothetical protein